jgi:membrane-associated phospholipid phosphatase
MLALAAEPAVPALPSVERPHRFDHLSVYDVNLAIDGTVIAAGALATLLPYAFDKHLIDPRCPCDQSELNRFDRGVVGNKSELAYGVSTLITGVAIAAPFAVDIAEVYHSPAFFEDVIVYAETLAISSSAVALTKHFFPRPLPLVYADPSTALAQRPEGYRAFYSGHLSGTVSMLTALAMTLHYRNGPSVWPWVLDAGVAASVAAGVIGSGRHFYTDVLAGGAIGFGIGVLVPWLHHRRVDPQTRPIALDVRTSEDGALVLVTTTL